MKLDDIVFQEILDEIYDGVFCVDQKRRVTYWNKAAEGITGYKEWEVLGRVCADEIFQHIDENGQSLCGTDRCPFVQSSGEAGSCATCHGDYFIKNRGGDLVPIVSRTKPLYDKNKKLVGAVTIFVDNSVRGSMKERLEELEKLTLLDPLTEVGNRRFAEINLTSFMEKWKRYGHRFGLLFIDIDHFKNVNDMYGHKTGDNVLRMVALVLKYSMRSFDVVARWGGEEFISIVYDVTEAQLSDIAERTRRLVGHAHVLYQGSPIKVTASIGATIVNEGDTLETIVARADGAMYRSKQGGRNRVTGTFSPLL